MAVAHAKFTGVVGVCIGPPPGPGDTFRLAFPMVLYHSRQQTLTLVMAICGSLSKATAAMGMKTYQQGEVNSYNASLF